MRKRRLWGMADKAYGKAPDIVYFAGDMTAARSYFDDRREVDEADFFIDDTTWDDLDMDGVFQRINLGLSNSGEQYLYYLLRKSALRLEEFVHRAGLIRVMEENPARRTLLYTTFARLGRRSHVNIFELLHLDRVSVKKLLLYASLSAALLLSIVLFAATRSGGALFVAFLFLFFNPIYHHLAMAEDNWRLATVQYCARMVAALKNLRKGKDLELSRCLEPAQESLQRLRGPRGLNLSAGGEDLAELFYSLFFIDLIAFERQKTFCFSTETIF